MYDVQYGSKFILLYVDTWLSQQHLLKVFFFPLSCLDIFVENQLTASVKANFWIVSFIPLTCMLSLFQ